MATRRLSHPRSTVHHLAEIQRLLRRNDRKMARLARSLEQLAHAVRERLIWTGPGEARHQGPADSGPGT